jgi:DNA mismatch endonuclease (patch repair protein)
MLLPYPQPSSAAARATMKANRRRDTLPERLLRKELHARGLRFRVDHPIAGEGRRVRPDIVFPRAHLAVFVDGCFWHRCPEHGAIPKGNREYWEPKLAANVSRDTHTTAALVQAGWTVVRVWEHEAVSDAADRIEPLARAANRQRKAIGVQRRAARRRRDRS